MSAVGSGFRSDLGPDFHSGPVSDFRLEPMSGLGFRSDLGPGFHSEPVSDFRLEPTSGLGFHLDPVFELGFHSDLEPVSDFRSGLGFRLDSGFRSNLLEASRYFQSPYIHRSYNLCVYFQPDQLRLLYRRPSHHSCVRHNRLSGCYPSQDNPQHCIRASAPQRHCSNPQTRHAHARRAQEL